MWVERLDGSGQLVDGLVLGCVPTLAPSEPPSLHASPRDAAALTDGAAGANGRPREENAARRAGHLRAFSGAAALLKRPVLMRQSSDPELKHGGRAGGDGASAEGSTPRHSCACTACACTA